VPIDCPLDLLLLVPIRYRWLHIGNDDVHIVWCECDQGYSPKWLLTRFGRVSIVIYPLSTGSFRVQVQVKEPLSRWPGPLVDGTVIDGVSLATLVRMTAVNVSHQIRVDSDLQPHYQIRADYLNTIMALRVVPPFEDEITSLMASQQVGSPTNEKRHQARRADSAEHAIRSKIPFDAKPGDHKSL
jgi:hypothetical protein